MRHPHRWTPPNPSTIKYLPNEGNIILGVDFRLLRPPLQAFGQKPNALTNLAGTLSLNSPFCQMKIGIALPSRVLSTTRLAHGHVAARVSPRNGDRGGLEKFGLESQNVASFSTISLFSACDVVNADDYDDDDEVSFSAMRLELTI